MTKIQPKAIQTIDVHTLNNLIKRDLVTLVDVRESVEYRREKIAGAILNPLSTFRVDEIPSAPDKTLILYCQTSNRSSQACQKLIEAGFSQVIHVEGGLNEWKQANYPTVIDQKAPISLMRQVQIVAGSLVFLGTVLGAFVNPYFLFLSGFVGAGLMFAGVTNTCGLAMLLAKLPYNRR